MKHSQAIAYALVIICCGAAAALVPIGGDFDLSWRTIDGGGGGSSTGSGFVLAGTIGQHDASVESMTGGTFALTGGFWAGAGAAPNAPCPADLTGDGAVNAADLAVLLGAWGFNPGHPADFNEDENVNAADLATLLGAWGPCP